MANAATTNQGGEPHEHDHPDTQHPYDPGQPVDQDPGNLTDAERTSRGIRRFPETAAAALDALEADPVLIAALGDPLAVEYLKVRRAEAAAYAEHDDAWEIEQHFFKY